MHNKIDPSGLPFSALHDMFYIIFVSIYLTKIYFAYIIMDIKPIFCLCFSGDVTGLAYTEGTPCSKCDFKNNTYMCENNLCGELI
jgi:hypothetical protein